MNGLTGVQSSSNVTSSTLYERDPNGTLLTAQTTTGTTTTSSYFYFDGTGSVIGLLDGTGKQVAGYTYDPYGGHATVSKAEAADTSIANANPWRYAGGQYDAITGLTKYGVRYYDSSGGRWTQLDPLQHLLDLRQGNRYAYAGADPINNTDPSGEDFLSSAEDGFGTGVAIGGTAGCIGGALVGGMATLGIGALPGCVTGAAEGGAAGGAIGFISGGISSLF